MKFSDIAPSAHPSKSVQAYFPFFRWMSKENSIDWTHRINVNVHEEPLQRLFNLWSLGREYIRPGAAIPDRIRLETPPPFPTPELKVVKSSVNSHKYPYLTAATPFLLDKSGSDT
jgi:hypothetical protein